MSRIEIGRLELRTRGLPAGLIRAAAEGLGPEMHAQLKRLALTGPPSPVTLRRFDGGTIMAPANTSAVQLRTLLSGRVARAIQSALAQREE